MRILTVAFCVAMTTQVLSGCGTDALVLNEDLDETASRLGTPVAEGHCSGTPSKPTSSGWRHWKSYFIAATGARHRGLDVVASSSDATQVIRGEASYGVNDKALEDEWVEVFACSGGNWHSLGRTLTDGDGHFGLTLSDSMRLSSGVRDLFVFVVGDRSSARFSALVAPGGTTLTVVDLDGTLTDSENAFTSSLLSHTIVSPHPNAAAALVTLHDRGYPIVYLAGRGRAFTAETRSWLSGNGFPEGTLRLAPSLGVLPGQGTVDYKTAAMTALAFPVKVGIGNRATDVQAYQAVGLDREHLYVKLPEFSAELQPYLGQSATGFTDYTPGLFGQL